MPELPEVETVCRGLRPKLLDRKIIKVIQNRPNLRIPFPANLAERTQNRTVKSINRRAKYIVIDLSSGESLIIHLGMSGRIVIHETPPTPEKHDHLVINTDEGTQIILNDPRRFGMVDLCETSSIDEHRFFVHLGPEPLGNTFDAEYLKTALENKKTNIKTALLDQRIVVGVGNIYAAEALYLSRISPDRSAGALTGAEVENLTRAIRETLIKAIEAGGSSLKDYVKADGELGYFQHKWAVYGKEGQKCPDCTCDFETTGGIKKITQGGRSTFYCPTQQN
jgi:formamidopyrimidine-DNA glycosylase